MNKTKENINGHRIQNSKKHRIHTSYIINGRNEDSKTLKSFQVISTLKTAVQRTTGLLFDVFTHIFEC